MADTVLSKAKKIKLANNIEMSPKTHVQTMLGLQKMYDSAAYALRVLKLRYTNGAEGHGVALSNAFCSIEGPDPAQDKFYPFGTIFGNGMRILNRFLENPEIALAKDEREMCTKLINYMESDAFDFFAKLANHDEYPELCKETHLSVAFAEHFLKKLALEESFILDRRFRKTDEDVTCRCGCGQDVKDKFKDTSLGHKGVWHGYTDIVIGSGEQVVPVLVSQEDPESSCDDSIQDEVTLKIGRRINHDQLIAQAIVFSFLHRKKLPSASHFLVPTIGICRREVVFYFYDAENDVLLQSGRLPLYKVTDDGSISISHATIIAVWLVLNYKYLSTGLTGSLKQIRKSNFFSLSSNVLNVYKEQLSFGNVNYGIGCIENLKNFEPGQVTLSNFIFPPDVERVNLTCLNEL